MPKKKEQYQYKRVETSRECKEITPTYFVGKSVEKGALNMCPYTPFIPLHYIMTSDNTVPRSYLAETMKLEWEIRESTPKKVDAFNKKWEKTMFSTFVTAIYRTKERTKLNTERVIRDYLERDEVISTKSLQYFYGRSKREDVVNLFYKNEYARLYQRSYCGAVTPYSLYYEEGRQGSYNPIPHMLAVVLPENYMYVKLHILTKNTIPLDRVIVLVDKELDNSQFPKKAFRGLYKDLIPHVLESACQVWKVPHEFIIENCFLPAWKLKGTTIKEMKEEREKLIDEFYAKMFDGDEDEENMEEIGIPVPDSTLTVSGIGNRVSRRAVSPRPNSGIMESLQSDSSIYVDEATWTWEIPTGVREDAIGILPTIRNAATVTTYSSNSPYIVDAEPDTLQL